MMLRAWLGVETRAVVLKSFMMAICLAIEAVMEAGITDAPMSSAPC